MMHGMVCLEGQSLSRYICFTLSTHTVCLILHSRLTNTSSRRPVLSTGLLKQRDRVMLASMVWPASPRPQSLTLLLRYAYRLFHHVMQFQLFCTRLDLLYPLLLSSQERTLLPIQNASTPAFLNSLTTLTSSRSCRSLWYGGIGNVSVSSVCKSLTNGLYCVAGKSSQAIRRHSVLSPRTAPWHELKNNGLWKRRRGWMLTNHCIAIQDSCTVLDTILRNSLSQPPR